MDIFKWFRKREEAHKYVFNIDQCGAIAILLDALEKNNNHTNRYKLMAYIFENYSDVKFYEKGFEWKINVLSPLNIEIVRTKKKKLFFLI